MKRFSNDELITIKRALRYYGKGKDAQDIVRKISKELSKRKSKWWMKL